MIGFIRSLEEGLNRFERRVVREVRVIREVGHAAAADAEIDFAQHAIAGLRERRWSKYEGKDEEGEAPPDGGPGTTMFHSNDGMVAGTCHTSRPVFKAGASNGGTFTHG